MKKFDQNNLFFALSKEKVVVDENPDQGAYVNGPVAQPGNLLKLGNRAPVVECKRENDCAHITGETFNQVVASPNK